MRDRGEDPDALPAIYRDMINHAIKGRPADLTVTTHVCRGNFRSTWISEGGYEPVAEILLGDTDYDGYFLEYDTDRAGGFEPLRFLPKGEKRVVLGLITSKTGDLEDKERGRERGSRRRRKFAPLDQFCLSPQCGFASTEEGNVLTEEAQWKKLELDRYHRQGGLGRGLGVRARPRIADERSRRRAARCVSVRARASVWIRCGKAVCRRGAGDVPGSAFA